MDNGNTSDFELDRLNLDTTSEDWDNDSSKEANETRSSSFERDQRAIGNTAITSPEPNHDALQDVDPGIISQSTSISETAPQSDTSELGQIIPMTMPENYSTPTQEGNNSSSNPHVAKAGSFEYAQAMQGDRLKDEKVAELQDREKQVTTDNDIASFVDFVESTRDQFQGKEAE